MIPDAYNVDVLKSTPAKLVEIYTHKDYEYDWLDCRPKTVYINYHHSYVRVYLTDGEVLQMGPHDFTFYLIDDPILREHRTDKNDQQTARLPWNATPDLIAYVNRAHQKVGYLVTTDFRMESHSRARPVVPV